MTTTPSMQQVPLPLMPQGEGRFDNFLPGPNAVVLGLLTAELPPRVPVFLWGDAGSGKTHLLQALAVACGQRGRRVGVWDAASPLPWTFEPGCALLIFDDVHQLSAEQQQSAFALCVEAQAQGIAWAAAAPMPPVDLPLRDDLRTRLGWGQIHALQPLDEEQTRVALGAEAERRGIVLTPEVTNYLMSRLSRDLSTLMRLLGQLDGFSLSRGRAVTVPLLRTMLAEASAADARETVPLSGSPA